tara:strand:+ start:599 stop:937 length:339 start_codon:yes stop_codon:yes gene_type:complete
MSITIDDIKNMIRENERMFIKFSANWCAPCKRIKGVCDVNFKRLMEKGIKCLEVDIDDEMDLYMMLKRKRILKGIPAIAYYEGIEEEELWYIPKNFFSGSGIQETQEFFNNY